MAAESVRVKEFLTDLLPFFYGRRITYVDVGAFEGKIFQEVLAAGLEVREAHLFEPNEASLQVAKESTAKVFKGHSLNFYRLALGSAPTKVTMRAARSMTKVTAVGTASTGTDDTGSAFEVECTTLDHMIDSFAERHISLLKVDVEGFELEVLSGAKRALADHAIDVIYIEAGMNPQGTQQCYYRGIEDALRAHGYSLYKIYEQQHEWIDDSPLLRRVNLAFMSPTFAASSPYRVTRELFQAHRELKELKARSESSTARIVALEQTEQTTAAKLAEAEKSAAAHKAECDRLKQALTKAEQAASTHASESDGLRTRATELEQSGRAAAERLAWLEKRLTAHKAESEQLRQALTNAQQTTSARESECDSLRTRAAELEHKWTAAESATAALIQERDALRLQLDTSQRSETALSSKLAATEQQLASARTELAAMEPQLASARTELERLTLAEHARQELAARLIASELRISELVAESDRQRAALTASADAANAMAAERAALTKELAVATQRISELSGQRDTLDSQLSDLKRSHAALSKECATQAEHLEKSRTEARKSEDASREVFKFIAQIHRRELKALKEAESARADAERVRAGAPYRLAESLIATSKSSGRLSASLALWRELKHLQDAKEPTPADVGDVTPVLVIPAEKPSAVLPLTLKPHVVRVAPGEGTRELVARIVGSAGDAFAELELRIAGSATKTVRLHTRDKRTAISPIAARDGAEVQIRRTNGEFCLLVLDVVRKSAPAKSASSNRSPAKSRSVSVPQAAATATAAVAVAAVRAVEVPEPQVETVKQFGLSYEAKTKPVPERPAELPADLALPPLRGVANDYSFIEAACEQRWVNGKRDYTLPVSIVIPVYNRSREVDFVLAGLLHQTYPRELMEIVIADDGSQEDLALVYRKYQDRLNIRYCRQEDLGYRLAEARNLGIATASHDSIVILDSDAIPSTTLVEEYMRRFHVERNIAMFGLRHYVSVGNIDVAAFANDPRVLESAPRVQSENSVATKAAAEGHSTDWREKPIRDTDMLKTEALPYRFLVGANCGFSREIFNKVGGYSDAFRAWGFEDQEFGYRLCREGAYFVPLLDAYVYHQEPLSGKNDTDRKLGRAITRDIFIQKCPFVYRNRSALKAPFEVPLVSIYVPLYNRERHIVECVESALAQTIDDLEVVICNDGSSDRSAELVDKHFGRDPRVRLITQKNGGIAAASNTAVRASRGFYIGQLDADDVLKRDAVEQCLTVMEQNPRLSLVYGTTEYIDDNSAVLQEGWNWPRFTREYLITRMICHHFRFFRKRDWARTAGFNENIRNAVDYDMMLKLAETGEVLHLNRVLYQYRKHAATTTSQENELQTQNNYIAINDSLRRMNINHYTAEPDPNRRLERAVKFVGLTP